MDVKFFLIAALVAILAYIWFLNRIAAAVQPSRLKMAELGESMIGDPNVPADIQKQVSFYLDYAYSWWPAVGAAVLFPLTAMVVLVYPKALDAELGSKPNLNKATRENYRRVHELFTLSQIAANPLFAIIVFVELIAFLVLAILIVADPLGRIYRALQESILIDMKLSRSNAPA